MKVVDNDPEKGIGVQVDYEELSKWGSAFIDFLKEHGGDMAPEPWPEIIKFGYLFALCARNIDYTYGGGNAVQALASVAQQFYDNMQPEGLQ